MYICTEFRTYCLSIFCFKNAGNIESPKQSPKQQNWKCCPLSLVMDGGGKRKLPFTFPTTGLSRIQHLNMLCILNFKTSADVFIRWLSWDLQCDTKYRSMAYSLLCPTFIYLFSIVWCFLCFAWLTDGLIDLNFAFPAFFSFLL